MAQPFSGYLYGSGLHSRSTDLLPTRLPHAVVLEWAGGGCVHCGQGCAGGGWRLVGVSRQWLLPSLLCIVSWSSHLPAYAPPFPVFSCHQTAHVPAMVLAQRTLRPGKSLVLLVFKILVNISYRYWETSEVPCLKCSLLSFLLRTEKKKKKKGYFDK